MSCLECGDVCSCGRDEVRISPRADSHSFLEGRALVDPEALDMSEQQFEDSLAVYGDVPRFVVVEESIEVPAEPPVDAAESPVVSESAEPLLPQTSLAIEEGQPEAAPPEEWRHEVAARLQRFRERRRLPGPRYPSLQLPFELFEPGNGLSVMNESASRSSLAFDTAPLEAELAATEPAASAPATAEPGKLIQFPRYVAVPMPPDELAEPAFVPPRILEAPETAPPQPALGGIILEAREDAAGPAREQVPVASLARRFAAAVVDGVLVAAATAIFGSIAIRVASIVSPPMELAASGAAIFAILLLGYQYVLLVYSGTTPGLRLAGLELRGPDGFPATRRLRRWRVLSSVLSLGALGLGYAWAWFDEERLCWHDRITRTCMQRTVAGERFPR
jgi:uncharacterized RDD family membrane protein YckC